MEQIADLVSLPADTIRSYEAGTPVDPVGGKAYAAFLTEVGQALHDESTDAA